VPTANPDTVEGMLHRLGDLLKVLDVSTDGNILATTYGQLQPPLGIHRLKIVEFIAVLLRTNSDGARKELVSSGAIQLLLKLFFDYPFNNILHHQVESIVSSCLESNNQALLDHLFQDCDFVAKLLAAEENPFAPGTQLEVPGQPKPTITKAKTRIGNLGHLTRIANRMIQASASNSTIQSHLQANPKWNDWVSSKLQHRNVVENVLQWSCGRPTSAHDPMVRSDDGDGFRERDYDISNMASNLSHDAYRYRTFDNDDADEDVFFDDESAEVVISSLRLGEEQDSSVSWFPLQDDRTRDESSPTFFISSSLSHNEDGLVMSPVSPTNSSEGSSSDDEVVLGEDDDLVDTATSANTLGSLNPKLEELGNGMDLNEEKQESMISEFGEKDLASKLQSFGLSENLSLFHQSQDENSIQAVEPPDWMSGLRETAPSLEGTSGRDMDSENNSFEVHVLDKPYPQGEDPAPTGFLSNAEITPGPPVISPVLDTHDSIHVDSNMINALMGEEVAGVESDGTAKAMEKMLKEGVVGEAGPIHAKETAHLIDPDSGSKDNLIVDSNFNDVNFWRSDYPHSVTEDEQL
jgi:serine/threonine-protein phosphatase 6 regulatory subunit 3